MWSSRRCHSIHSSSEKNRHARMGLTGQVNRTTTRGGPLSLCKIPKKSDKSDQKSRSFTNVYTMRQKKVATLIFAPIFRQRSQTTLNISSLIRQLMSWMAPSDRLVYVLSKKYRMSTRYSHPWRVTLSPDRRVAVGKDRWCTLATASFQKNLWGILPF